MGLAPQFKGFAERSSLQFHVERSCFTDAHDHTRLPGASGTPNCCAAALTGNNHSMARKTKVFVI